MPQQLSFAALDLKQIDLYPNDDSFMLWCENTSAGPEEAIRNANQYYRQKYGKPVRIKLPLRWLKKDRAMIDVAPLIKAIGLSIVTDKTVPPKHVAVYGSLEE